MTGFSKPTLALATAFVLLLQAGPRATEAALIYSQPLTASPTLNYGYNSNGMASGNYTASGAAQQIIEGFTLSSSATVNQLSWYGTYADGRIMTAPVSFLIRFASNPSANAGTIFASQSVSVTATDTGLKNVGGQEILSYSASLANVALAAGSEYLSILENDPAVPVIWTWQFSDFGSSQVYSRQSDTGAVSGPFANNMAFALSSSAVAVPEPSSLILCGLFAASAVGCGRLRSRGSDPGLLTRSMAPA